MSAKKKEKELLEKKKNEIMGILIIAFGLFSGLALFSSGAGVLGQQLFNLYMVITGTGSFIIPLLLVIYGVFLVRSREFKFNRRLAGVLISYFVILGFIHTYIFPEGDFSTIFENIPYSGGVIGWSISRVVLRLFGPLGSYIMLGAILLIGILLWFDISLCSSLRNICDKIFSFVKAVGSAVGSLFLFIFKRKEKARSNDEKNREVDILKGPKEELQQEINKKKKKRKKGRKGKQKKSMKEKKKNSTGESQVEIQESWEQLEVPDGHEYQLPPLKLLKSAAREKASYQDKSELLEETLSSFGVEVSVTGVSHGPSITRYKVQPRSGVKVSKIVNLADDIALALAAPDVRIEAPIPGKGAIGIEVPHQAEQMVRLRDILASKKFQKEDGKLLLALGKAIEGRAMVADLSAMPHLLVAGATGSGKSVCLNSFIISLLFNSTPEEIKLILIDPKKVELSHYKGLPHLFTPVVTDPKKASNVLKLVVEEMEKRYDKFQESGTRGINGYNRLASPEDKLPYLVVIIDELSDLMMVAASEVEDSICRLAQMSRAAGIHLIIATQRPSVDVITGLIKANIPSRISFAVSSQTDSRTILDMGGAEKLLGNGDMLYAPVNKQKPIRIQGSFISDEEINYAVRYIKQQVEPDYEVELDDIKEVNIQLDKEKDELYEKAVRLVVEYRASISMLQRKLHIGHSRAARMIDMMEEEGIVGPHAGSKPREVLISEQELPEYLEGGSNSTQEYEQQEKQTENQIHGSDNKLKEAEAEDSHQSEINYD